MLHCGATEDDTTAWVKDIFPTTTENESFCAEILIKIIKSKLTLIKFMNHNDDDMVNSINFALSLSQLYI